MKLSHIPWLVVLVLVGGLAFYFWKEQQTVEQLLSLKNEELMTANLELGRARTQITDQEKVHRAALANLNSDLVNEIKARRAAVAMYAEMEALYKAEKKKVKTITKIITRDGEVDLPRGKLFLKTDDGFQVVDSLTYAYQDFRIQIEGDAIKEWLNYQLHQRFKLQLLETTLPSGGKNHYAKIYEVDDKGKVLEELELTDFEVLRAEDLPNKFFWWNPKLDLMVGGGITSQLKEVWIADFGISLASYGKTPDDLLMRFVRFGAGITNNGFSLSASPVQLNVGKYLPLVSNLWLTPYAGFDFGAAAAHLGAGVSVVF